MDRVTSSKLPWDKQKELTKPDWKSLRFPVESREGEWFDTNQLGYEGEGGNSISYLRCLTARLAGRHMIAEAGVWLLLVRWLTMGSMRCCEASRVGCQRVSARCGHHVGPHGSRDSSPRVRPWLIFLSQHPPPGPRPDLGLATPPRRQHHTYLFIIFELAVFNLI